MSPYLVTPAEDANLIDQPQTAASVNWVGLLILQLVVIVASAGIIAWRNQSFLDRKWSAATSLVIFIVGMTISIVISLAMSL